MANHSGGRHDGRNLPDIVVAHPWIRPLDTTALVFALRTPFRGPLGLVLALLFHGALHGALRLCLH
jgi:hypothetical protein